MPKQETWDGLPDPWEDDGIPPAYRQAREWRETGNMWRWQRNVLLAPLMGCPPLVIPWRLALGAQWRSIDEEGAHAKRSVAR
jgi:hypothetical protein